MEVRANAKDASKIRKVRRAENVKDVQITVDERAEVPSISVLSNGKLVEFLRGVRPVKRFLKFGYNRIQKQCPIRHRRCIGERCSWYVVRGGTGDCAVTWNAYQNIMMIDKMGGK